MESSSPKNLKSSSIISQSNNRLSKNFYLLFLLKQIDEKDYAVILLVFSE